MSSNLKDARWQLAEEMATDDGFDWFKIGFTMKSGYLETAQERLEKTGTREYIDSLAKKFREASS